MMRPWKARLENATGRPPMRFASLDAPMMATLDGRNRASSACGKGKLRRERSAGHNVIAEFGGRGREPGPEAPRRAARRGELIGRRAVEHIDLHPNIGDRRRGDV